MGDDGRGRCDPRQVLRWLGRNGVSSLLVEGGGEVVLNAQVTGLEHDGPVEGIARLLRCRGQARQGL